VKIGCDIVAHECKEARDSVSGVALADKLAVNSMSVENVGEEGGPGINRDDKEDAHDVFLFVRPEVMQCVLHDVKD
jgi:hypothetical protein